MRIPEEEKLAWLALSLIPGIGSNTIRNLLERFESPEAIFKASRKDLLGMKGVRREFAEKIARRQFRADPERELVRLKKDGVRVIIFRDPLYPPLLKELHDPPMLLYLKGNTLPVGGTMVAVVGSRNASHYGLNAAEQLGTGLAKIGIGVVSGLARGIDSAAHRGCVKGKGFTVAVLGTGVDRVYPASNRRLMDEIAETGAVVSEFPLGSPPEPKNFPMRNRIISGLSRGVAVVEATLKSGSLITASLALEQGREVFAVPGSINSYKSRGTHRLIRQGATLVENADHIARELGFRIRGVQDRYALRADATPVQPDLDEAERPIYELLGDDPMHIDEIVRMRALASGEALGILMRMELKGLIVQLPGKTFVRSYPS